MQFLRPARRRPLSVLGIALSSFALLVTSVIPANAQAFRDADRARGRSMLGMIKKDVLKNYYDPKYHGIDVEARFKAAEEEIGKANSNAEVFQAIAQTLVDFHDSHLFFIPPSRSVRVEYGWQMAMIGDACYVTAVKPGSDAEAKGLRPGDAIAAVDGFRPTRENLDMFKYVYYALRPRVAVQVVAVDPAGKTKQIDIATKVTQGKAVLDLTNENGVDLGDLVREAQSESQLRRHRYFTFDEGVMMWKMPGFNLEKDSVDKLLDEAKKRKALVLDLRGNGGGREETLLRLVSGVFDHDVNIGTIKLREGTKPLVAKTRGGDRVFKGAIVVLVDGESGSAAELFARIVQLEKRGTVIGDRSAGAVMRSRSFQYQYGVDSVVFFGASITEGDLVMADGKSLERIGVQPDEVLVPSGADLASGKDPVLARASALAGFPLDAAKAGALFPVEWQK